MRTEMKSLLPGILCSCALLITGTLLADSAAYELPEGQWRHLRGGDVGLCATVTNTCDDTAACKTVGGQCDKSWYRENQGYWAWGCTGYTDYGVPCTPSNQKVCAHTFVCTTQFNSCVVSNPQSPGTTTVDAGCTDVLGSHGDL
jgi:hypothetical protein